MSSVAPCSIVLVSTTMVPGARRQAPGQLAAAEQHVAHGVSAGQAQEDDLRVGQFGHVVGRPGALCAKLGIRVLDFGRDDQLGVVVNQVQGHRLAHLAKSDEADSCALVLHGAKFQSGE